MTEGTTTREHERALIACALQDQEVCRRESAAHLLTAEMFEAAELGAVWRAIGVLLDRGDPIEPLSVGAVLADDAGMTVADLAALQGSVPATANASYYAGEVRKGHVRRALERLPDEVRESGLAPAAQAATLEVRARRWRELLAGRDNLLPEALTGAGWEAEAEPREWLVDGWLPVGELAMLAGPGSVGKSLLALQLGAALACDRDPLHATNKRQPVKVRDSVGWLPKGSGTTTDGRKCALIQAEWPGDRPR